MTSSPRSEAYFRAQVELALAPGFWDCLAAAETLAALFLQEGHTPWIGHVRKTGRRNGAVFQAPLIPLRSGRRIAWTTHYVCVDADTVYDPVAACPLPLGRYGELVFGEALPVEPFVAAEELGAYLARSMRMAGDPLFLNVFTPETCAQLVADLRQQAAAPATVHGGQTAGGVEPAIRSVSRIVPTAAIQAGVRRLLVEQTHAIEAHFGLELGDPEEPQFLRYGPGDHFVAHQDGNTALLRDAARSRRISVVVFLNPQSADPAADTFGGGSLLLHGRESGPAAVSTLPGTLVALPSETTHEVTPVTRGERYTIVSWFPLAVPSSPSGDVRSAACLVPSAAGSGAGGGGEAPLLARIIRFIRSLGIRVDEAEVRRATLMPGIDIRGGTLVVDETRMCKPADLLHEAAHIALRPASDRPRLDGTLDGTAAEEMAAIAWTWAAAIHLGIDPPEVFHDEVVSGNGPTLRENFSTGHYVGVPMLQYWRMTRERARPGDAVPPYPHMIRWTRDA